MSDVRQEVREHNRRAVQRLFAEKQRHRPPSGVGAPSSRPSTSSTTLAHYLAATAAAEGEDTPKYSVFGSGPPPPPAWHQVSSRGVLLEPSLDVPSHLSQQLQLSAEVEGGRSTAGAEDRAVLLAHATSTRVNREAAVSCLDPKRSCFALHVAKHQHRVELTPPPAEARMTEKERRTQHRSRYHRQQAILRNEAALARKRAASCYTGLVGAQADAAFAFPNAHTLDRLVQERYHGQWPLDNPYRQQLLRGEPVMTQVMRGDFYEGHRGRRAPDNALAAKTRASSAGARPLDAQQVHRRDVRVASAINASVRREAQMRAASPPAPRGGAPRLVGGGCYCSAAVASASK